DCSFEERPAWQRKKALADLQKSATRAGLNAPVAAVWRVGSKLRFVAPTEWHPFLSTLTWNTIVSNLSSAINCHEGTSQAATADAKPDTGSDTPSPKFPQA